jgi:hypothetical protein
MSGWCVAQHFDLFFMICRAHPDNPNSVVKIMVTNGFGSTIQLLGKGLSWPFLFQLFFGLELFLHFCMRRRGGGLLRSLGRCGPSRRSGQQWFRLPLLRRQAQTRSCCVPLNICENIRFGVASNGLRLSLLQNQAQNTVDFLFIPVRVQEGKNDPQK